MIKLLQIDTSLKTPRPAHERSSRAGFTLIEIIVATSLFLVVMTISTGALLAIIDANTKAQSLEIVMNNLNFALESMARNIRVGYNYDCGATLVPNSGVNDCEGTPGSAIAFVRLLPAGNAQVVEYAWDAAAKSITQRLETSPGSMGSAIKITSDDVIVDDLEFYVVGTTPKAVFGDTRQPRVLIKVRGEAGTKANLKTKFAIQTTVTMRRID